MAQNHCDNIGTCVLKTCSRNSENRDHMSHKCLDGIIIRLYFSVAVEVNATVSLRSSRSASPADKSETLIQLDGVEDGARARVEFPITCEKPATPDEGVSPVLSGSESPAAMESDEEILIVETERAVYEGSPVTVTDAEAIAADRGSPVRKAMHHIFSP